MSFFPFHSKRGPQGGYSLLKEPAQISLAAVIRAVEGPIALGSESSSDGRGKRQDSLRVTDAVFRDLSASIESCFDAVSIADLCERAEELGIGRPGQMRYAYVI